MQAWTMKGENSNFLQLRGRKSMVTQARCTFRAETGPKVGFEQAEHQTKSRVVSFQNARGLKHRIKMEIEIFFCRFNQKVCFGSFRINFNNGFELRIAKNI